MELSGGISGYVLRARASTIIEEKMGTTMSMYGKNNTEITLIWDKLQHDVMFLYSFQAFSAK